MSVVGPRYQHVCRQSRTLAYSPVLYAAQSNVWPYAVVWVCYCQMNCRCRKGIVTRTELLPHPLPSVGLDFSEAPHELLICSRSPQRVFEEKHLPRTWEWPNEVSTAAGRAQTRKVSWLHAWGAFWGPRLYRVLGYGLWEGVLRNIFLEIRWC